MFLNVNLERPIPFFGSTLQLLPLSRKKGGYCQVDKVSPIFDQSECSEV